MRMSKLKWDLVPIHAFPTAVGVAWACTDSCSATISSRFCLQQENSDWLEKMK